MLLLAAVSGVPSFAMTIVVPALPAMAARFDAGFAQVQLLISAYVLGLALAQPIWGHFTDTLGRRPVALLGSLIFIASSLACLLEPAINTLAALRVLQAIGASAGTVAARAVIRDTHSREEAASAMSWVSIGLGAAPIIAPVIGGALLVGGDTKYIFAVMGGLGAGLWLLMYRELPETLPADAPRPAWSSLFTSYATLLRSRGFVGYTAVYGFFNGVFFAFLAVGAAVFQDSFGLGPTVFGTVWGCMGISYVIGAATGGRLSAGRRRPLLLPVCTYAVLALGMLLSILDLTLGARIPTVLLPLFLMMTFTGAAAPMVMAGAVYQVPHLAGTASGLSSAVGMAGSLYRGDFTPIAVLITAATLLSTVSYLGIRRL